MPAFSTNPGDWFLTPSEMPAARTGSLMAAYTSDNLVEYLIDGENYFWELHGMIMLAGSLGEDHIFLAGWELLGEQCLLLGDDNTRVDRVFKQAYDNGVYIRVLLSDHVRNKNRPIFRFFNDTSEFGDATRLQCVHDSRHPTFGSCHQKFIVIKYAGNLVAFCGGIDLTLDRWDDRQHSSNSQRQTRDFSGGWHDIQCKIVGPATLDFEITFRDRWNDRRRPNSRDAIYPLIPDSILPLPSRPGASLGGTHHVQILRTYACENGFPFAPQGEFTYRDACLKAIRLARDYVYIEDQYFVSHEVKDALECALSNNPNLRVILVVPKTNREPISQVFYYQQHLLTEQLDQHFSSRFAVYHLETSRRDCFCVGLQFVAQLDQGTLSDDLVDVFEAEGKPLEGGEATVTVEQRGSSWEIDCGGTRYLIRNESGTLKVYSREEIYVHSKLMIVDDVWVSIGSMNCNRRSMTHDTEIGIAVIDSQIEDQACVFARNLRRELWREHLCLEDGSDIPIDPIQAFDLWRSRTTDPSVAPIVHAVGHRTPPGRFNIQDSVIWNQIGDPQGVCSDQLWIPPS